MVAIKAAIRYTKVEGDPNIALAVQFVLDDGRGGTVSFNTAPSEARIEAAISAWASARSVADPLVGKLV